MQQCSRVGSNGEKAFGRHVGYRAAQPGCSPGGEGEGTDPVTVSLMT